jgi:hypothetical protein
MKKPPYYFFALFALFISCQKGNQDENKSTAAYETIDYLTVRKHLDTLNSGMQAQLDSTGSYTIPYTDLSNGKKHLVFFGASHTRDIAHPQFKQLEKAFRDLSPEIAFNEGGQIPEDRTYPHFDSAIQKKGETGCVKYLCDESGIKMMNGDMEDTEEFTALLKIIPQDQVYLYMATERFLNPFNLGHFDNMTLDEAFQKKFIAYLERSGFPLTDEEKTFPYLSALYKRHLGTDLNLDSLVEVHEYYLIDEGMFGKVGRATKEVRDQALLRKIDAALDTHDRVFVVFGGSHRIAVQPALKQIINRKR